MKMYLASEATKELNCSDRTLKTYIYDGRIKAVKIGNKWQISQEEIDYIKKNGLRKVD